MSSCPHRVAMMSSRSVLAWTGNQTSRYDWPHFISTSLCPLQGPIRRSPSSMLSKSTKKMKLPGIIRKKNWCVAFLTSLTFLSPTVMFDHSTISKRLIINLSSIKNSNYSRIIFSRSLWEKESHCFVKLHLSLNLLAYSSKPRPSR